MSKKISTKEYINICEKKHNNFYDYSLVKYTKAKNKVKIICPIHGIFEQEAFSHKNGSGCSMCSGNKKLTTDVFIKKIKKIYGNKYDYSLVEYNGINSKIKIIFNGEIYKQRASSLLKGILIKIKIKNDVFIKQSIEKHGNKYDYSLVDITDTDNVDIICKYHGVFSQNIYNHLKGHGCSKCKNLFNYNTDVFILKAKKIHGNKYDYSLVKYINNSTKLIIKCPKHGIFKQTPNNHLTKKQGCPKCNGGVRFTTNDFISKAKKIHGNKYDYSLVDYTNTYTKIKIICQKHGVFSQRPDNHLNNSGCPICNESKGEKNIRLFLKKNKISYIKQFVFEDCKDKRVLPFDFYLPDYNIIIEFDGIQHFEIRDIFGEDNFIQTQKHDIIKNDYCKNNNIHLLRIKYTEINNINKILEKKIIHYDI